MRRGPRVHDGPDQALEHREGAAEHAAVEFGIKDGLGCNASHSPFRPGGEDNLLLIATPGQPISSWISVRSIGARLRISPCCSGARLGCSRSRSIRLRCSSPRCDLRNSASPHSLCRLLRKSVRGGAATATPFTVVGRKNRSKLLSRSTRIASLSTVELQVGRRARCRRS